MHRLRIAGAERARPRDARHRLAGGTGGAESAVDQQRILAARGSHVRGERTFEVGAERRERILAQRDAGRHGVAAALEQEPLAHRLPHHAAEIDTGDRAARTGSDAARLERDRKRRPAVALLQPRRDEADDARDASLPPR